MSKISELSDGGSLQSTDYLIAVRSGGNVKVQLSELPSGIGAGGNIVFGDNEKAIFGAGSDLEIYHDSATNDSIITESGAGNLVLQGDSLRLTNTSGVRYLQGNSGAEVNLWHNGNKKLETTSTGIDVTGTVTADGLTVDGGGFFETGVRLGNGYSAIDVETGASGLYLSGAQSALNHVFINSSGNVGINATTIAANGLQIGNLSSTDTEQLYLYSNKATFSLEVDGANNAAGTIMTYSWANGGQGSLRFKNASSEVARLDASGNVGIGTIPSSWGGVFDAIDVGPYGSFSADNDTTFITNNAYYNGTSWIYKNSNLAGRYRQQQGLHVWDTAVSGTAGGTLTWSEAMRIDASGNVGLGVTPSAWSWRALQVGSFGGFFATNSAAYASYLGNNAYYNGANWVYLASSGAVHYELAGGDGAHKWYTAPSGTAGNAISFTQAMTLDSSGRLLVGGTTAESKVNIYSGGSTFSSGTMPAGMTIYGATTDGQGSMLSFKADSGAQGIAGIAGVRSSGWETELRFYTNNTASQDSFSERMRITSGGFFKASNDGTYVGSTASYHELRTDAGNQLSLIISNSDATNPYCASFEFTGAAPNDAVKYFWKCADTTNLRAALRSNGGLANYQSNNADLSDERTKKDIAPAPSYWDKIGALEIVTYKYNDQTHDDVNVGVIAQQVEAVEPVWVDSDGFGETPEGEEPLKTVYTKDITFAAIKALQEAMARIETLEAEVAALKGA